MDKFVITIARGFGSGGKEIAVKVADKLGISCYEKEILTLASEQSGINEELFHARDERLNGSYLMNRILKSVPYDYAVEPMDRKFTHDNNLYAIQKEIMIELASRESCVIVGKCADHALVNFNCLRVFIDAPIESCVKSIEERMAVDDIEATRLIHQTNKYRSDYYKYYTGGKNWNNPLNYDLCLNTGEIDRDECVGIIIDVLKKKFDKSYGR